MAKDADGDWKDVPSTAAPAAAAPRTVQQRMSDLPKTPESTLGRWWRGLTTPLPRTPGGGEESTIAHGALTGVSEGTGQAAQMLSDAADQAHQQDLSNVAHGGPIPTMGGAKRGALDLGARV